MTKAVALDAAGITKPFAVEDVPWAEWSEGVRFAGKTRDLGRYGGGSKIGVVIEELPPGKQSCPFHYHLLEEEHMLFLEGRATLRLGDRDYEVKAGDFVTFPAGQQAGHCLVNRSAAPCRYLIIGDSDPREVCVYPDSDKVRARLLDAQFTDSARRDYWDGEKTDEAL